MPKITIIGIGDELLIGQVIDTNSAFMGKLLNLHGMEVAKKWCIADGLDDINHALEQSLKDSDIVLITGGLGPTKDDITKKALASFLGVKMVFSDDNWAHIQHFAKSLNFPLTDAHKEQAYMPEHAILMTNRMGTAPAMWMEYKGKIIVSMPGVPYEMKYLMKNEVVPKLQSRFKLRPILHRTILTVGIGESSLALAISDIEDSLPDTIKLAYLPNLGNVRLRLSARGENEAELKKALKKYGNAIYDKVGKYIYGEGDTSIATIIGEQLKAKGLTLATAESCTGGYIAHQITANEGASAYFQGSIIAYDNAIKQSLLGVKPATLDTHGAVSEQTVVEMAKGALQALNVDVALSISGIAGPGGGTPDKPVGTVWIAVATKDDVQTLKIKGGKKREQNIQYATTRAFGLLWNCVSSRTFTDTASNQNT